MLQSDNGMNIPEMSNDVLTIMFSRDPRKY